MAEDTQKNYASEEIISSNKIAHPNLINESYFGYSSQKTICLRKPDRNCLFKPLIFIFGLETNRLKNSNWSKSNSCGYDSKNYHFSEGYISEYSNMSLFSVKSYSSLRSQNDFHLTKELFHEDNLLIECSFPSYPRISGDSDEVIKIEISTTELKKKFQKSKDFLTSNKIYFGKRHFGGIKFLKVEFYGTPVDDLITDVFNLETCIKFLQSFELIISKLFN